MAKTQTTVTNGENGKQSKLCHSVQYSFLKLSTIKTGHITLLKYGITNYTQLTLLSPTDANLILKVFM